MAERSLGTYASSEVSRTGLPASADADPEGRPNIRVTPIVISVLDYSKGFGHSTAQPGPCHSVRPNSICSVLRSGSRRENPASIGQKSFNYRDAPRSTAIAEID